MSIRDKKLFLFFAMGLIILGCNSRSNYSSLEEYFINKPILLRSNIVRIDSLLIGNVLNVESIDSLIFLKDAYDEKFFSLIDIKNRKLIMRFGLKGRGPNEIVSPGGIRIDEVNKTLEFIDIGKKAVLAYHIEELLDDEPDSLFEKFNYLTARGECVFFRLAPLWGKNKYVSTGLFKQGKYGVVNHSGDLDTVVGGFHRPEEQKGVDNYTMGMAYQGDIKSHPTEDAWVHATSVCDLIEIVKFSKVGVYEFKHLQTYYPKPQLRNASGIGVKHSKDIPHGFLSLDVTSRYIYTLYSGKKIQEVGLKAFYGNRLFVFDWDLNPICSYHLDRNVNCISVSSDDKEMYAVAIVEEPELVKWQFTH